MSKLSNVLKLAGVLAGVVIIGLLIGWLGSAGRHASIAPGNPPTATVPPPDESGNSAAVSAPKHSSLPPPEAMTNETPAPVASLPADLITNWGDKLEQILTSPGEEADK